MENVQNKKKNKGIIIAVIAAVIAILGIIAIGILILIFALVLMFSRKKDTTHIIDTGIVEKPTVSMVSKEELYDCMMEDCFPAETEVEKKMKAKVKVNIISVESDKFTVEIEAPDISEELFAWMESQETGKVESTSMEEAILKILEEEPFEKVTFEIPYEDEEELIISYSAECKDVLTCGMIDFYNMAMNKVLEEMKEGTK